MKIPDKIYLQVCGDCSQTDCLNCKFEDLEDNITWCKDQIFSKDIEYTRTDVFIEKAEKWLKEIFFEYENLTDYNSTEDFKNYMKEIKV